MGRLVAGRRRVKLSATVDAELLEAVDRFVGEHEGTTRSMVIDEALQLWAARERERAMEAQFLAPQSAQEAEDRAAWRRIRRSAAARRLFRSG